VGKTFNNFGNSNTIAYKAYPRGWKFHGIVWTISGNFMGKPHAIMAITEGFMGILWDCMGYFMGIL